MPNTSSTELQTLPSTSIFDILGISTTSILVSAVSIFLASPTISTIVSIPSMQAISARTVETKPQPGTIFLGKGKEKEEDTDFDEEIFIPKWDISNLNPN